MTFIEKLVTLCTRRGVSPRAVALDIGFDPSAIAQWKRRGGLPRPAVSAQIADYFGITVEDLLDDSRVLLGQEPVVAPVVAAPVKSAPPPAIPVARQNEHPAMNQAADALRAQAAALSAQADSLRAQAAALVAIADQIDREPVRPPSMFDTPESRAEGRRLTEEILARAAQRRPFDSSKGSARSA